MAEIIEGDVVGETVNLQVVRRPKGERPRFIVLHHQSGQQMTLLSALQQTERWGYFVPSDKDKEMLQKCRRFVANTLARRDKERRDGPKSKKAYCYTVSDVPTWIALSDTTGQPL